MTGPYYSLITVLSVLISNKFKQLKENLRKVLISQNDLCYLFICKSCQLFIESHQEMIVGLKSKKLLKDLSLAEPGTSYKETPIFTDCRRCHSNYKMRKSQFSIAYRSFSVNTFIFLSAISILLYRLSCMACRGWLQ